MQHSLPQAVGGLAVPAHFAQSIKITLQGSLARLLVQIIGQIPAVFDQKPAQTHVRLARIQNTVGHLPITSRASGLLIVAFQVLRHVVMDDIGHVGLVDAHAKSVGRHHDALAVIEKIFLRSLTGLGIQSGVIACRSKASTVQNAVHVINQLAGQTIDDAALLSSSGQFRNQCRLFIGWMVDKKAQIGTVKAGYQ